MASALRPAPCMAVHTTPDIQLASSVIEAAMLTRILLIGILGGAMAGSAASLVQGTVLQPMIVLAEAAEAAQPEREAVSDHDHGEHEHTHGSDEEPPGDPIVRKISTAVAVICTAMGYGLMLSGVLALCRKQGWRAGLTLGAIGFLSFQLAPGLGIPPQPPGMPSYDVHMRQLWWLLTAFGTLGASFSAIQGVRRRKVALLTTSLALIALPHILRFWLPGTGPLPELAYLTTPFVLASFAMTAVLWLSLGAAVGFLQARIPPYA
ncbi:MAG: CbtA family protein [Pseudomonadota bacterium]|uniref:CbtA family protein n=1 Tax=Aquabacterium parvum TaxID=70584 RepID=UPI0009F8E280